MALADPGMRGDIRVSASAGFSAFGKHSEFSKPMGEFTRGLVKDHEIGTLFDGLKTAEPLRTLGGTMPGSAAFGGIPSLAVVKDTIKQRLAEKWGPHGYVLLRQSLHGESDHEGFIGKEAAARILRTEVGVSESEVSEEALSIYLKQQLTMKASEIRVSGLLSSLRPSL